MKRPLRDKTSYGAVEGPNTKIRFTAPAAAISGGGYSHLRREPQISTTPDAR